jgi:hypothetical protein
MNAKAKEGLRIFKQKAAQGKWIPSCDLERDLLDFIRTPGKSNATALFEKLRQEAGYAYEIREDLERWESATRQRFSLLLAPQEDEAFSIKHIYAIYESIKEEIES